MEMEVDEGSPATANASRNFLFVCYVTKKSGLKRTKVPVSDLKNLTLETLRSIVCNELNSWEWADATEKPQHFGKWFYIPVKTVVECII